PFTTDPSEEHQQAPVPKFECDDPRLLSVIQMMLRKPPESRPSLDRVRHILEQIGITRGVIPGSAAALLAEAGAKVAEAEARAQAKFEALKTAKLSREAQAKDALQRLSGIQKNLWRTISDAAPAARIKDENVFVEYLLGNATLSFQLLVSRAAIPPNAF